MPKKKIPVIKKAVKEDIREWVKLPTTQYFINKIALHLNSIDTVRDINEENIDTALARSLAITVVENVFADIYQEGDLEVLQREIADSEENILQKLRNLRGDY